MKLLGWMHRKFKQNSSEPFKDFVLGQASADDQQFYTKQSFKPFKHGQKDEYLRKSFTTLEAARVEEEYEEEASYPISDLFHGFLAIGTLGSDQLIADPATPKFSISIDNVTEKETEVTEDELKLINEELEKVLAADSKEEEKESSRRNSHASLGRSSHGSTITLSGKPIEVISESNINGGSIVCPLQEYLFGSAIEMSETTTAVAKKEHRTSLGELFQKSKMAEESCGGKCEKEEKGVDKSAMYFMKKKLKKKMLQSSSRSSIVADAESVSAETKLHKILHMFHRKVYPENYIAAAAKQKGEKAHKGNEKKKKSTVHDGDQSTNSDEDIMIYPHRPTPKRYFNHHRPSSFTFSFADFNDNKEQWIKTDADYLVLEL